MGISRTLKGVTEVVALAVLIGCGSGGEEGGATPLTPLPPLTYVGNTKAAVVTANNAGPITANVFSTGEASQDASKISTLAAAQGGMWNIARHMHRTMRATPARNQVFVPGQGPGRCDSGEVHVSGVLSDNGTGTVSIAFDACQVAGTMTNGSATLRIDAFERAPNDGFVGPTDHTITFNRLTLTGGLTASLSGSIHTHLDIPARIETITDNTVVLFGDGAMAKSENLVFVNSYDFLLLPHRLSARSISGRVFHSVHGWIDIATGSLSQTGALVDFPIGALVLNGAGSAISILVSPLSPTLVDLGLDLDGDAVFERSVRLAWTDISGPVGADLGDSDDDGMHNGWEAAHGLNPNDASDATTDADGDGASNWQEYDGLADPRNASSLPARVDLSIQAASPNSGSLGRFVEYTLTVSSSGPPAKNVVLTNSPPASANLVAASAGQGSCGGAAPVVCTLGTVGSRPVSVRILVSPTIEGIITNTASVSTASFDPVVSDNSVTSSTTVGPPEPEPPEVPTL